MSLVWNSLLLVIAGVLLLRIAGRKSISQMTLAQTVVMISIGSIIIQPIIETSVWRTLVASAIFIGTLIIMEYLQLKFNIVEKFITGKSKVIIENGSVNVENLKKLRFTVDQLEMRLRQLGITKIADVKVATLEPNGQIGYELIDDAKPLTVGEFKKIMTNYSPKVNNENIFSEIEEGHSKQNPDYLQ
ncbi:DUF421 domain-containing protein [Salirhabdus salicampi]|uniref:DUF421 domain-containing protein n=1 Tax=Salirhabdus salicampi TaxID=476102 RepID=UPI0020C3F39A|nr:YetF domain-containing protein [Salirhabdus salicampi]MCP8616165.1 DUF421 domain-containing protein [Salirhabdus salicampi]